MQDVTGSVPHGSLRIFFFKLYLSVVLIISDHLWQSAPLHHKCKSDCKTYWEDTGLIQSAMAWITSEVGKSTILCSPVTHLTFLWVTMYGLQNGVVGGNRNCSSAVVLCTLLPSLVHTSLETHRDLCLLMHQVWQDKHQKASVAGKWRGNLGMISTVGWSRWLISRLFLLGWMADSQQTSITLICYRSWALVVGEQPRLHQLVSSSQILGWMTLHRCQVTRLLRRCLATC